MSVQAINLKDSQQTEAIASTKRMPKATISPFIRITVQARQTFSCNSFVSKIDNKMRLIRFRIKSKLPK